MSSSDNKKVSIYDIYFNEQEKYSKIYGDKTIVFIQIGKFYEAYCNKTKGYINLAELEPLLNIKYIRRDGKNDDNNKPNQFGINCVAISKNLATLTENGYTVVLFDQKTTNGEDIERECVGVFSPGTYLSDRQMQDANYLLSVYISEEKQLSGKNLMAIGLTIVDVSTGTSMVHEFYSNKFDERFGLDELVRIMQTFRPTEIVVYYKPIEIDDSTIKSIKLYLELEKFRNSYFFIYHDKKSQDNMKLLNDDMFKINFQNDYLSSIFDLGTQLTLSKNKSAIEVLDLQRRSYATLSLMIMLKYIAEHNVLLLKNLSHPEIYLYDKHLILGNNAIEQLNIIDSNNLSSYNKKIESVYDVINKTTTPMGKRFLKDSLLNPLSQDNKYLIIKRYDIIDHLLKNQLFKKIQSELKNIYDMERLHRRMAMGIIVPYEFYRLDTFYQATNKIIGLIKDNNNIKNILGDSTIKDFLSYQIKYNQEYDLDKLHNYSNFIEIDSSFFKIGVHPNIDKIQEKITYVLSLIQSVNDYLTKLIGSKCKKMGNKDILTMESNDREGYFFTINKSNEKILKQEIEKCQNIKIELSIGNTLKLNKQDFVFKQLPKGRTKIFVTPMVEHTINLSKYTTRLTKLTKKLFIESMVNYYSKNKIMMHKICKFIAEIDFLTSGAIVADQFYYCKPQIVSQEKCASYIKVKGIRHAIVERLCNETEYVPNDIELGNVPDNDHNSNISEDLNTEIPQLKTGKNGVVLFSLNWTGKSTLMKAIGISIILAQIGYYVPAQEFIYEPYMALYARITGNDNIFKGLSSFALEMTELDAILMRTECQGKNTLVIGDEVCRGTEDISGRAIVASALVSLSECNSTFIFSSHLHDIQNLEEIQALKNLRFFHLRAEYDEENDCIIFDRKLMPGSGPSVYGLMVAKYLVKNVKFINRAEKIKKRLMNETKIDIPTKTSNYNKKLLVKKCCICDYSPVKEYHKELESHHIHFQQNCWENGKIKEKPYLHKNRLYNLVVLCRKCHNKVHQGEIIINGYIDTINGPMLDYRTDINVKIVNSFKMIDNLSKQFLAENIRNPIKNTKHPMIKTNIKKTHSLNCEC
ncbi:putative DNA mismatch repair protein muts-like protein [Megavirus chiliensis]|uniref:DNA mismatch repair MutS n=2 Tax=Megamimivirinae TaxID=3044648 RepID=A0A2L2DMK1_MIMIV|nr:putative DNA mismatch repair protein muts-like protein [Megavirus chiliensis]AEQ33365.1 putative DNA mismatch repair protein muts-like protein [Megavirus chiliensis]AVG47382.1 DNA mismatch repair MutS [Acanthamoeba polyphaga mimivirus]